LKALKLALKQPGCNPQTGAAAVTLLLARRKSRAAVHLFMKLTPGEIQRRAAAPLVHGLVESKNKLLFRFLLWRRRGVLARDDAAWGQVGYALSNSSRMKEVVSWLSDWRTRQNVQPWMLFNLCLALRHLGRYDEANAVARYVVEKWEHREGSADMRLFLAVEEALAGSIPEAAQHLDRVVVRENVPHDQGLLAQAKALVEFQQCPPAERAKRFKAVRRQLQEHFPALKFIFAMKDIRRTFRRSGKVFVRAGGGWRARLWFFWKLNWQWSLLLLAPVALAFATHPPVCFGLAVGLVWAFTRNRPSRP
jgi:hypothetical protein